MAPPTVPTGFPARLIAGDTVVFDLGPLSDARGTFASTDYGLTLTITSPGGKVEATGVAQGSGWRITLSADNTRTLKTATELEAETLRWFASCSASDERYTVSSGTALLWPDPASLDGYTSPDERILALLYAKRDGTLDAGLQSYSVQGRAFQLITGLDLEKLIAKYESRVSAARNGGAWPAVGMRFR